MGDTELRAHVARLGPQERARFEQELAARGLDRTRFPVTLGQEAMLFLEELVPGNLGYLVGAVVRAEGPVDRRALARAVDHVVDRHEALRTTFVVLDDGAAAQEVHRFARVEVEVLDLGPGASDEQVEAVTSERLARPLDVHAAAPVRIVHLGLGPDRSRLLVSMHHLVCDGWSMGIFVAELAASYRAFSRDEQPQLPAVPVQYGDYATWHRARLGGPAEQAHLDYWAAQLDGAPAALTIPTDHPRPAVQGFAGAAVPFLLDRDVMERVNRVAHATTSTPFMVLMSAYAILLSRLSGQDDLVVGVPHAHRDRPELEGVIGYFVTMLPIRVRLGEQLTVRGLVEAVRTSALAAYEHQDVTFEQVLRRLQPPRDLSRSAVFQACLSYQQDPFPAVEIGPLTLAREQRPAHGARFDVEVQAFTTDGTVHGWLEYDRGLFDEQTVRGWAGCFEHVVAHLGEDLDLPVAQVQVVAPAERERLLALGCGPRRQWPEQGSVVEIVREAARRWPQACAVRDTSTELTYAGFDERVDRLAEQLTASGLRPGRVVGVVLERSVDYVVALHAVLRAGAAYLPVEVDLPQARVRLMLDGVDAVLTVSTHRRLADVADAPVWCLDDPARSAPAAQPREPRAAPTPDDPAYVIYTSGSTGTPKGVVNTHRGLRNRLLWMQDAFPIGVGDVVLQKTPYGFDVSVWELFWPLMTGATLAVLAPGAHRDPSAVMGAVRQWEVSVLHFVPSMLRLLLAEPGLSECSSLRYVVCSGEALTGDLVEAFTARSQAQLHNLYGPTEAAIDVTWWSCTRTDERASVPIGTPIANTQVRVLDAGLEPVPVGAVGEIVIGGDGVAAGYRGRPDLTAERFVPDPHGGSPGARLYRTGDLGRVDAAGVIEYLGRADGQVKLRGQRIELGEVEAVLGSHPQVASVVVQACELAPGDTRLVAYVTGNEVADGDLAAWVRAQLPDYMVPTAYVHLQALPLTVSGKVDRAALPRPAPTRDASVPFVGARTDTERVVLDTYREVLGVDRVGVDDGFFDLGGHSLLLVEARRLLNERLSKDVSMLDLFRYPTAALLAAHLGGEAPTSVDEGAQRAAVRQQRRSHADARRSARQEVGR